MRAGDKNESRLAMADQVFAHIREELDRAWAKFPRTASSHHEAWAVLHEEHDELWDEVKANNPARARLEAIQVAAMAVRFIVDLYMTTPGEK